MKIPVDTFPVDWKNKMIVDKKTGEEIKDCISADDRRGEYLVLVRDEKGRLVRDRGVVKTELKKGRIKVIKRKNIRKPRSIMEEGSP